MQLHSIGLKITYTAYSSQPKHNIINTQNDNAKKHPIIKISLVIVLDKII